MKYVCVAGRGVRWVVFVCHQHPNYGSRMVGYPNDIAVVHLSNAIEFNDYVHSIPFTGNGSFAGQSCKTSGWGRLSGETETGCPGGGDCQVRHRQAVRVGETVR